MIVSLLAAGSGHDQTLSGNEGLSEISQAYDSV